MPKSKISGEIFPPNLKLRRRQPLPIEDRVSCRSADVFHDIRDQGCSPKTEVGDIGKKWGRRGTKTGTKIWGTLIMYPFRRGNGGNASLRIPIPLHP